MQKISHEQGLVGRTHSVPGFLELLSGPISLASTKSLAFSRFSPSSTPFPRPLSLFDDDCYLDESKHSKPLRGGDCQGHGVTAVATAPTVSIQG